MPDGVIFPPRYVLPSITPASATERYNVVQHRRTATANNPPPDNFLLEGEFCIEMADPIRLWIGVPTALDPTGRKLFYDAFIDAPDDLNVYGRGQAAWQPVLPLSGGTLTGPLTLASDPVNPLDAVTLQYMIAHTSTAIGCTLLVQDTTPAWQTNTIWWDSLGTQLYVAVDDGTSQQWVIAVNQSGFLTEAPLDGALYG